LAYAIAIAALAGAVLLRWLLDPILGDSLPFVTLFGAVAIAVWVGGYRAAVLVGILGYLACNYLFIAPRGELGPADAQTVVGLLAYVFTCLLIVGIGEAMRRAQQRAREGGELLRVTLESIGDAVITTDTEGRVTYLNAIAEALTGWKTKAAVGQALDVVFRIVDEKERRPVESPVTRALREGAIVGLTNHTLLIAKDDTERPIDDSAAPIKDGYGRVVGCVLVFRDISDRRRWEKDEAERLLSARLLASIVESSDDAIVSKSLDGVIRSWNAGAERLFGYSANEALGRHISLIISPERGAEEDQILAQLKAGQRVEHFETERVRKDGTSIPVSLTISPISDAAGNVVGASKIARDITDRKRAEAERQKFVTLVETSTDFIGMCDLDGVPFYVNRAGLAMVGLGGMAEAQRVHVRDFFFPEDQAKIMDEFFPSVIQTGHAEIEVRFRNFRTHEARWMAYKVLAINDSDGRRIAFATVSQDITERRRLEDNLRKLAADLSEVDRRKNEFLATLAHELRNPLAPLHNMLEFLKRADADAEARAKAVATMQRQLSQLVRLVDDLLDLNRITHDRLELRRRPLEIGSVIEQAIESCRPLAESAGHEVRTSMPSEPIHVHADEARLTQVLANLVNNSCKYTNPGGKIAVTAKRDGDDVVITVSDNGIGIPPERLGDIFDMFMQVDLSAERSQGGLGIGLTLVKRLVEMHGGAVEAKSAGEGQGSEFVVRLPTMSETQAMSAPQTAAEEGVTPRRILVVDDNMDAAASLVMLLRMAGHETYMAHDGRAAIEAVEKHRPEVVFLDIGLPSLNGYEVCRRIRRQPWGSDIVLIALTGWGQEKDLHESRKAGFDTHLVKPVDYAALMALLDSLAKQKLSTRRAARA
jgi:PAS domain S-box-containing protein